jgi:hypothetical protein
MYEISEWQIATAPKVISTSLFMGERSMTSSTFSGFPNSCATAAFMLGILPLMQTLKINIPQLYAIQKV